ncbi:6717_t:CDS:2 [Funneliformis caledonium]|uniref:6717_t:CDS:1 n=1 Tax=Funneliformis caledonium TaxID=1117310 RepID=A0A9N9G4A1_9GLOM|nr:6717_t:CDS:2 [Funneliformis caledonium]
MFDTSIFKFICYTIDLYRNLQDRRKIDLSQLEPTTKIVLDGGKYSTLIRKNGKFKRKEKKTNDLILLSRDNVPPGSYLLEVTSRKFIYPKIRIDVDPRGVRPFVTITGSEWSYNGPALQEGFSITSLFANPYIIMMGFSVVILFIMPKMMANLDQDALKELQENQAQNPLAEMPDISTTLANYLSEIEEIKFYASVLPKNSNPNFNLLMTNSSS